MTAETVSDVPCRLGEGPLWHPELRMLFWCDVLGQRLHAQDGRSWLFDEPVSALGWVSRDALVVASASGLWRFDIASGARNRIVALEADNATTRSNDGRADPWGGFWIGTMGLAAEPGAGALYRYWRGTLRRLVPAMTIPNAICFAPDRSAAFYADTAEGVIWRQPLALDTGWPEGAPGVFVDLSQADFGADGAVIDAEGCLWNARWGAGQVARYGPDGQVLAEIDLPTPQTTCPAFGGADFTTLYVTSAADGIDAPRAGHTFALSPGPRGLPEPRVVLAGP